MPGGIRTPNLLIRSQKLYPVELQARMRDETTRNQISPVQNRQRTPDGAMGSHAGHEFSSAPPDHSSSSLMDFCAQRAASIGTTAEKHGSSWGGQRDSNPQQPEPQSGALPLSYGHRRAATLIFSRPIAKAKQRSGPRRPLQALGASAILRRPWDE